MDEWLASEEFSSAPFAKVAAEIATVLAAEAVEEEVKKVSGYSLHVTG